MKKKNFTIGSSEAKGSKKSRIVTMEKSLTGALGVALLFFAMVLVTPDAIAQTGTVAGEVTDASTGEVLPGTTILIEGTTRGVTTDVDGRYRLRSVPVGEHTLIFRYVGFVTQEITVSVEAGESVEQNVVLQSDFIEGEEVLIVGHQRGQARALTMQRESINIRSVMSSEQIDRTTATTVSGALDRVTGMHGGTNIRGVGSGRSNVTIDGQRMGTTGSDRSVDLSTVSTDMVRDLEIIKVITPDMDADALAGVININTRRPVGARRELNVRLGGGSIPRYYEHAGAQARAAVSYGDSPSDDFSYALNFSYQRAPSVSERTNFWWDNLNFGEGPRDVLYRLGNEIRFNPRHRYGTGLQMTFQPSERTTYHVQGMFNIQQGEGMRYIYRYYPSNIERSFISPNESQPSNPHCVSCNGDIRYNARMDPSTTYQYTMRAGARHLFENFDMEYKLGWGHSRVYADRYDFEFRTNSDYHFLMHFDDRHNPTYEAVGPTPNANRFRLNNLDNRWTEDFDNELSATIDFEVPFEYSTFKFGTSSRLTLKDGNSERFDMESTSTLFLSNFDMIRAQSWQLFGREHSTYHMPWFLDLPAARDYYHKRYPNFRMDDETWAFHKETSTYYARESTSAAYGMGNFEFGRFNILGGVRVEYANNLYEARQGGTDISRRFLGAETVIAKTDNLFFFPNAQLVYGLGEMTNVRLAYSRSIGRPSFNQISPYQMEHHYFERIDRGNPNLRPMISDNFDFIIEHYFMNVGELTFGLFYKDLTDFVYRAERRITPGQDPWTGEEWEIFGDWRDRTYFNGDEATVYGFESSWQQRLQFLPGFLGNFTTFLNYTYTYSRTTSVGRFGQRDENVRMTNQRPHIANAGLDYDQGSFSASMFFSWSTPRLVSYGELRHAPEIEDVSGRVYFDTFEDGRRNLTLAVRYRLGSNFRIWLDASNLLSEEVIQYEYDRDYYPDTIRFHTPSFSMGVRYSL